MIIYNFSKQHYNFTKLNYKLFNLFCKDINKIKVYGSLDRYRIEGEYEEILNIYKTDSERVTDMFTSFKTSDIDNILYVSTHAVFENLINKGIKLIQITGEPVLSFKFDKKCINYLLAKNKKQILPESLINIKNYLYLDMLKLEKIESIQFIYFFPRLDNNNQFYYIIIIGVLNFNYETLNNLNLNLIKNLSFFDLKISFFNYDFFKNLYNLNNNVFEETGSYKFNKLILNQNGLKMSDIKNNSLKYLRIKDYLYKKFNYTTFSINLFFFNRKTWMDFYHVNRVIEDFIPNIDYIDDQYYKIKNAIFFE